MITAFYERNGVVTEMVVENKAIEPIERELKVFTFAKKERKPHRRIEGLSLANQLMFGLCAGGTITALVIAILVSNSILQFMFCAVLVLDLIMVYENLIRKQ